jgi:hypothetical protein
MTSTVQSKNLPKKFPIQNGLNQEDALHHCFSTLLWNMPLEGTRKQERAENDWDTSASWPMLMTI